MIERMEIFVPFTHVFIQENKIRYIFLALGIRFLILFHSVAFHGVLILETFLRQIGINQKSIGILSTKIMLGTWGTVPAFDTSLKTALRAAEIGKATYSRSNFLTAFTFLHQNAPAFQAQVNRFHAEGFAHYPAMRVIDALLRHLGGGDNTPAIIS